MNVGRWIDIDAHPRPISLLTAFVPSFAQARTRMAGGRTLSSSPSDLLQRIKGFVRSLVEDLSNDRPPSVALDRYRNYCHDPSGNCTCGSDLPNGKEIISVKKESHAYRLLVLLRVLLIIQQLLQENKHGSKRDIYYMHPALFLEQAVVDRAINDICILLKCSRQHLNVVPVGKGLVMGWLRFLEAGRKIYCINSPSTAYPIPVCLEEVEVFQRLANDRFCERNHCIVITKPLACKYLLFDPLYVCHRFLCLLVQHLHLPVYCLVDCDPYGFDILMVYRFGSMQMAYDANLLRVPEISWLGVFHSDLQKYHLPDRCLLELTSDDKKKAEAMLLRCYLHKEAPKWRMELEVMLQNGVKFEIESLSVNSLSFLSEYIPMKIQDGSYL
ncbi:meiotic recombination protein [Musa troglodytarum]|uniref:DNA topoisomerase (ATP-hydrolyzing) n=1 Tax=Musa troglodytarum TaxID=320322 RepID=A0A9E7L4J1_9LILI|nr:meiotic recombination protein [Musa troglodytarum]URE45714.1 meiotic recombination protein [Musa troglodytarum]